MKAMYFKFQFSAVLPSADRFCGSNTADKASSTATSVPVRHFSPGDDRNMLDHSNVWKEKHKALTNHCKISLLSLDGWRHNDRSKRRKEERGRALKQSN